jgi:hypothetical protein
MKARSMKIALNITIITILTVVGCKSSNVKKRQCIPYFQYDEIDHYSLRGTADSVWNVLELRRNERDRLFIEILCSESMTQMSDTVKLSNLLSFGFAVHNLPKDEFAQIDDIFCERRYDKDEISVSMCIPAYRDILIFKKENHTIGYARLCFECELSSIVGSKRNTRIFGQFGEFEKLKKLFSPTETKL